MNVTLQGFAAGERKLRNLGRRVERAAPSLLDEVGILVHRDVLEAALERGGAPGAAWAPRSAASASIDGPGRLMGGPSGSIGRSIVVTTSNAGVVVEATAHQMAQRGGTTSGRSAVPNRVVPARPLNIFPPAVAEAVEAAVDQHFFGSLD